MRRRTSFSGVKNETRERVKGRMRAGGWDDYKLVLWLQALVAGQRSERDARLLGNLGDAKAFAWCDGEGGVELSALPLVLCVFHISVFIQL